MGGTMRGDGRSGVGAAVATEFLKLRRGTATRVATLLLVVLVPLFAVGLVALARTPELPGAAAVKFVPWATGELGATHLLAVGQILSVAVLLAGGFVAAWSYGREFTEGTAGALSGLPVGRDTIGLAKGIVLAGWGVTCVASAVAVTLTASLAAGGRLDAAAWANAGLALAAGVLAVALALPFGCVATLTRSQLGTVGVLIGVVMVTEIAVVLGAGAWFPWAVPSLLTGMGGAVAQAEIGAGSVLLSAAVGPAALVVTAWQWRTLDNT